MKTPEDLVRARKSLGLTQAELARRLGISETYLSLLENGKKPISDRFRLNFEQNVGDKLKCEVKETTPTLETVPVPRRIPVVGMAAAAMYDPALSQICDLWEGSEETVPCVLEREGIFAIRIQGDSMEPALHDGDVVAVDPNELPKTGDTAVVCLREDGLVIKRWFWRHGVIRLESLNTEGRTFEWTKNEVFQKGIILWRWKVLGILWRKL